MKPLFQKVYSFTLAALVLSIAFAHAARVKDITYIQGISDNYLQGYGLVTGLSGTGDKDLATTNQMLQNLQREYGVNVTLNDIESENVAVVLVSARIGPYAKPGDNLDVTVSTTGDAESLQGGVLSMTPLKAGNGKIYAVAQGPVSVGGFIGGEQGGSTVQKNHPTVGRISGGARVERPITTNVVNLPTLNLKLHNVDFTTAVRTADALNRVYPGSSQAVDGATINVMVPQTFRGQVPNFIAAFGGIEVRPDVPARIVINERNGTIVVTEAVSISPVAISYGALTIKVSNAENVSQPGAFSGGDTVATNDQATDVTEQQGGFVAVQPERDAIRAGAAPGTPPTVQDLANGLNKLGVTTRDMINILHTLEQSGALHADIIVE